MDFRLMGLDAPLLHTIHNMLDNDDGGDAAKSGSGGPTRTYVRDAKAMAATPTDVKEYPSSYVFVIDMPGLKSGDIKVQVEEDNVLNISGKRKREEEEGAKYDGVLTVTVEKLPPPQPKKPKTIEVKIA
ncbi:17.3 kDa class II heat shock protein-like [Salvia divinorum]|uniref:17.3 kDa class II heat shock protein-like n=1 Tax=Salvia divinorum TaxID=28513 RepID=A0ABD1FNW2_SALDI